MGTADGTVLGTTKILDNGPATQRYNMLILSEGYRGSEMAQFAADAQQFANTLFATAPYDRVRTAINIHRVDVTSTDSGAADPAACGGTGASPHTYFDGSFCNNGIQRLLEVNNTTVLKVASAQVPQWHMALVIVNTPIYGGSGGAVATFSKAPAAMEIALHEMGHTAFGFADEYEYYAGCGVDVGHDNHPGTEPIQPNVTINPNRGTIKWRDLILATTPMPTTSNTDCSKCDPQPSPVSTGTVGAFEGADYYHCGSYRPEFNCRMRALGFPFCAVCEKVIVDHLAPFLPAPL
jgi:IgA Peptidase M64